MIHKATQIIENALEAKGLKYQVHEIGGLSLIDCGFSGENCTIRVNFLSADEDCDVKILSLPIAKFPKARLPEGYELMNALNAQYRFVKWVIDKDGDIHLEFDMPSGTPTVILGDLALEVFLRMVKIADDAYPTIMRKIWAEQPSPTLLD